ncbi:MAG: phosphatase PAP2 family protein [Bacteroidota bacterium]
MKYFCLLTMWIICLIPEVKSQSPYTLNPSVEPRLTLGSLLLNGGVGLWERELEPLSLDLIMSQDPNKVNGLDRIATQNWNPKVAKVSDAILYSSIAIPLTLGLDQGIAKGYGDVSVMWLQTLSLNFLATSLTKVLVKRRRPYTYNPDLDLRRKINTPEKRRRNARLSFFSGHTSTTAAMAFFTAQTYNDFYPDKNSRYMVWASSALIPAAVGLMRVKAGRHYPTDVIVGYLVGAAVGILVPRLHR